MSSPKHCPEKEGGDCCSPTATSRRSSAASTAARGVEGAEDEESPPSSRRSMPKDETELKRGSTTEWLEPRPVGRSVEGHDEQNLQHESMPGGRMTEGEQVTISAYLLLARGQIGNNEGSTALRR